jgi:hypothetical protein
MNINRNWPAVEICDNARMKSQTAPKSSRSSMGKKGADRQQLTRVHARPALSPKLLAQ